MIYSYVIYFLRNFNHWSSLHHFAISYITVIWHTSHILRSESRLYTLSGVCYYIMRLSEHINHVFSGLGDNNIDGWLHILCAAVLNSCQLRRPCGICTVHGDYILIKRSNLHVHYVFICLHRAKQSKCVMRFYTYNNRIKAIFRID